MGTSKTLRWLLPQLLLSGWVHAQTASTDEPPPPPSTATPNTVATDESSPTPTTGAPVIELTNPPESSETETEAEPTASPATDTKPDVAGAEPSGSTVNETAADTAADTAAAEPSGSSAAPTEPEPQQMPKPRPELPLLERDPRISRTERPFTVGGEIGWNSLAGLGVQATYHFIPHLALDAGAGVSQVGLKGGLRVRANLFTSEWTPVVGVGFMYGLGTQGEATEIEVEGESVTLEIRRSKYVQAVAGMNYTSVNGFVFMATAGYAFLLSENVQYVSGSEDALDKIKRFFHGGVSIAFTFGYAF